MQVATDFKYTACYCEENAWHLIENLVSTSMATQAELFACFISNRNKTIPIFHQRSSARDDGLVVWDYHVIVIQSGEGEELVWDLDTTLPFPCTLDEYEQKALADIPQGPEEHQRLYRLIPARDYLEHFASDRSHMKGPDGSWLAPPPPWPCSRAKSDGCENRISEYWDMDQAGERLGKVGTRIRDLLQ